ncbi:hybrid sensor histidine kinase/response regulator [Vibrio albus]|uniref:histidine kinase n=1 Tax=Vibrio albus TaxID=2200953 RepID=A0A2U3BBH2_9VIBR|nr:ATP-binding protein [Vibrio albus]PWI34141.1 hybrid sensor histidine kinase/response regulator [Vibrio albus]
MDILEQESLQEALQELRRSKDRQRILSEENEAILTTISAISSAENRQNIFNELLSVLRKYIQFDDALVLMKADNSSSFSTFLSTDKNYDEMLWREESKFVRALKGECILLYEPKELRAFESLPVTIRNQLESALVTGISTKISQSVIILIGKEKGKITIKSKNTLQRFRPLIERAVIDIDHKERLQSLVSARTTEVLENKQRFHDFANSVGDWLWETDESCNFTYQSNDNISFIEIKNNNLKDSILSCNCGCDMRGTVNEVITAIESREPFREKEICLNDGNSWISISGRTYYSDCGNFLGYRGSAKDITAKIRQVSELKKAKKEALEASKAKSEFLAMMSHEIRTPLNTVLGLLDVLLNSVMMKEQRNILQKMEQSAELLLAIISDILDLSRIESGHFSLDNQSCQLKEVISNSIQHHSSHAERKKINLTTTFSSDLPDIIWIDPTRLSQILFNLVGNAIKFTPEGKVSIRIYQKGMKDLIIEVQDTGIGIPSNTINLLFQPFKQADGTITRQFGGTGLGLAITKKLLELMKGSIEVNSIEGDGSCFIVSIPMVLPSQNIEFDINKEVDEKQNSRKILLAEDNKTNQMVIKLMLNKLGHEVFLADNGQEAVELLKEKDHNIDLVFMDISMPVLDGLSAARKIRESGTTTPIVALTAHAMDTDKMECFQAGMSAFITKPVRAKELKDIINAQNI